MPGQWVTKEGNTTIKLVYRFPDIPTALQINIIPLPITMNRKMKKPPVKLNFRRSNKTTKKARRTRCKYMLMHINK